MRRRVILFLRTARRNPVEFNGDGMPSDKVCNCHPKFDEKIHVHIHTIVMRSWLTVALPSFALPRPDSTKTRQESSRCFGIWIKKQELRAALGCSPIQASPRQKEDLTAKRTMQRVQRMALVGCAHAVIGA